MEDLEMAGFEGLENLFQNKLFLQYLAGVGADLSAFGADTGKGFQPTNINAITQQNIQSQNFIKMLQKFLGPDGSKMTIGADGIGMKLTPDSSMFSDILQGTGEGGVWKGLAAPWGTPKKLTESQGGAAAVNPFASSQPDMNISPADLAGLTPSDISTAMGIKLKKEEIGQKSVQDIFDMMYKGQLIEESRHRVKVGTPTIPLPGHPDILVTPSQLLDFEKLDKETKAAKVKEFEFAQSKEGGNFKGTFMEFQNAGDTVGMKDFKEAKRTGYPGKSYYDYKISMAKAGAINLGAKLEEKKAISELGGQTYFDDPKWSDNVEKATADYIKDTLWKLDSAARDTEATEYKVKLIEGKINAGGGQIVNAEIGKDGMGIWTVKWPSGDTKKIKYKLK